MNPLRFCPTGILFILGIVLHPFAASSDPDTSLGVDQPVKRLDGVVVTATRNVRQTSELPVSVSVISSENIDITAAHTVDDLLSGQTGVQVRRSAGMGEGVPIDIVMRGIPGALAATRILVLVDGIPTNAAGTPFLILNVIPLEAIERVEIVRGPYSALYGANAFGGVINIITKNPVSPLELEVRSETSLPFIAAYNRSKGYRGGEFLDNSFQQAYYNNSFLLGAEHNCFNLLLSGGFRTIGNFTMRDSVFVRSAETKRFKAADNHGYSDGRLILKSGLNLNDNLDLTLHTRYFQSDLGWGLTRDTLHDPPYEVSMAGRMFLVGPQLKASFNRNTDMNLGGFFRVVEGVFHGETPVTYQDANVPSVWHSNSSDWQFEGSLVYRSGIPGTWTAGFDCLFNTIDFGATLDSRTSDTIEGAYGINRNIAAGGFYLQNELKLPWRLELISGLRLDLNSAFSPSLSPKIGIVWQAHQKLFLRASSGTAFRAPAVSELFMPDMIVQGDVRVRANPELEPERIQSYDAGFTVKPFTALTLVSTVYYNVMSDLITQQIVLSGGQVLARHSNINSAVSWGTEQQIEWEALPWINLNLNYNYQNTENVQREEPLDYIPFHSGALRASFHRSFRNIRAQGSLAQLLVGERGYVEMQNLRFFNQFLMIEPYTRTDLYLKCTYKQKYWASLSVQNMFNADIEESQGTLAPGRFFSLELGARVF